MRKYKNNRRSKKRRGGNCEKLSCAFAVEHVFEVEGVFAAENQPSVLKGSCVVITKRNA